MEAAGGGRLTLRRQAFWVLVLAVIGLDLWWSLTPVTFEWWWIPLFVVNGVCLAAVLLPLVRGKG